jgi:sugar diacid utilization regulator
MNQKQIIKLAKQAGLRTYQEQAPGIDGVYGNWEDLENFAHLVAAAARADEREALEKIDWTALMREGSLVTWGDAQKLGDRVLAAIRARGTT